MLHQCLFLIFFSVLCISSENELKKETQNWKKRCNIFWQTIRCIWDSYYQTKSTQEYQSNEVAPWPARNCRRRKGWSLSLSFVFGETAGIYFPGTFFFLWISHSGFLFLFKMSLLSHVLWRHSIPAAVVWTLYKRPRRACRRYNPGP